jgi:hypothetical protein
MNPNPAGSLLDRVAELERDLESCRDANKILRDTLDRRSSAHKAECEFTASLSAEVERLKAVILGTFDDVCHERAILLGASSTQDGHDNKESV